jgi:hypothetical protein
VYVRLCGPPQNALRNLWSVQRGGPPRYVRRVPACLPMSLPAATVRAAIPLHGVRDEARLPRRANVCLRPAVGRVRLLRRRARHCAASARTFCPAPAASSAHPRVALSKARWRSLAWSSARRAGARGHVGFLRVRTRRPASLAPCLGASPASHVGSFSSVAWLCSCEERLRTDAQSLCLAHSIQRSPPSLPCSFCTSHAGFATAEVALSR